MQTKREKEERDKGGSLGREGDAVLRGLSADSEASGEDGSGDEDDEKLSSKTRNTKSRPKRKRKKDCDGDYRDHQRIRIKKERHVKREMKRRDDEERETEEQESIEEEQEREDEEQEEEEEQEDGERRIGIGGMMLAGGSVEDLQIHLDQNQSPSYLSIHNTTGTHASLESEEGDAVALGVGYPVLAAGSQPQLPDYLGGNPYIVRKVPLGGGTSSSLLEANSNSNSNSWSPVNRLANQRGLSGQPGVWQNFDFTPFLELKEDLDVSSTNQPVPIHQDSWSTSFSVQAAHNSALQSPGNSLNSVCIFYGAISYLFFWLCCYLVISAHLFPFPFYLFIFLAISFLMFYLFANRSLFVFFSLSFLLANALTRPSIHPLNQNL